MHHVIAFRRPYNTITGLELVAFCYAAFNVLSSQMYGQTGFFSGLRYFTADGDANTYHPIDWAGEKQRRLSYSSYGAEILACADADGRRYNIQCAMQSISPSDSFSLTVIVDSKGLFETITTLYEATDY